MRAQRAIRFGLMVCIFASLIAPFEGAQVLAAAPQAPARAVSPWELIAAMNSLRVANGLPPLIEDPIVNAVAQGTAEIMAANLSSWHIGDVTGRIQAAGYGGGARVLATENFAVGSDSITIDAIISNYWADFDHMRPATEPQYCHVGAGSATASNGMTYYILQAAAVAGKACEAGNWTPVQPADPNNPGAVRPSVPGIIVPVTVAEPGEDGVVLHKVKSGQSFWAIAVAYKVTIKDILRWNNLPENYKLQIGDVLKIPTEGAVGFHTPTPAGTIQLATPDAQGRTVHKVAVYQNLSTIAAAYGVSVDTLLRLNHWKVDWPLQIGQELIIAAPEQTPTPTERPLTAIEMLTPEADGKYYHVIREGQNLTWIAIQYGVSVQDLLAWNGATAERIWHPGEKLLLQVTPPATPTQTPAPATPTPLPSLTETATATATVTATIVETNQQTTEESLLYTNTNNENQDSPSLSNILANKLHTIGSTLLYIFFASLIGLLIGKPIKTGR